MAKAKANPKFSPDLLADTTTVEVVKLDKNGEFVGMKLMSFGQWKSMEKQSGYIYRAYQKGFSKFKNH